MRLASKDTRAFDLETVLLHPPRDVVQYAAQGRGDLMDGRIFEERRTLIWREARSLVHERDRLVPARHRDLRHLLVGPPTPKSRSA
jgi:hypothetical protein